MGLLKLLINTELPLARILWAILDIPFLHFMLPILIKRMEWNSLLLVDAHFMHFMQTVLINRVVCKTISFSVSVFNEFSKLLCSKTIANCFILEY